MSFSIFKKAFCLLLITSGLSKAAVSQTEGPAPYFYAFGPAECDEMMVWDVSMGMCMPIGMEGMSMQMLMLHGNAFLAGISEQGARGRTDIAAPNMVMADLGTTLGETHYFNLDLMATAEKWTIPPNGYPELLQIGETNSQGLPFLDAQHPHSSPIMGLTFSDTIRLDTHKNYLKLSFAPRGETTDGPIAFMHRPTGMANPDAPLGHHIGQDVGHVSSTVIAASLKLGNTRVEASTFHGAEPQPTQVDLPIGAPDSLALRVIEEFSPSTMAMVSYAYVQHPEPDDSDIAFVVRYSASLYQQWEIDKNWKLFNALIFGLIAHYDHSPTLASFGEEFWLRGYRSRIWGRAEVLQRTSAELQTASASDPNFGLWLGAITLGYTHALAKFDFGELALGFSGTADFIPNEFSDAYGGHFPLTGKIFLQVSGMQMWDL